MTRGSATNEIHASDAAEFGTMLKKIERFEDQIASPTAAFQRKVRTERKDISIKDSIAVICAFAAMGTLATNIFLPSLPAIAADLRVSSAVVTSTITVFLAIFAVGQLIVGPLSTDSVDGYRFWPGFPCSWPARFGARSPAIFQTC